VNSEDKSGFAAFQAILFTSVHFQPAAYTRFNKSSIGFVKNWDKIEIANFADLPPLCPFFTLAFDALKSTDLAKYVRDFELSPKLPLNHPYISACA
tara:strand:- start:80 stop:367 length:288 start_codon:yes stop_codon:yes gene_type:complete